MDMPEPKAWAQQLANHLVECLQYELVSLVQQGVRDELRSFFSTQGTVAVSTKPPLPPLPPPMLPSINQVQGADCSEDNQERHDVDSLKVAGGGLLRRQVSAPATSTNDPESFCQEQNPGPSCLVELIGEAEQMDGLGKEQDSCIRPLTRHSGQSAAPATSVSLPAARLVHVAGGHLKGSQSCVPQSCHKSPRFSQRSMSEHLDCRHMFPTTTCDEDQITPIFMNRHYRAYQTAKEIQLFEKEKQAETYVHLLRDMAKSPSRILSHVDKPLHEESTFEAPSGNQSGLMRCLIYIVTHVAFDYTVGFVIVLNAAAIGIQTDWIATSVGTGKKLPKIFSVIEWCFACFFMVELAARVLVYRCLFFRMPGRNWNIFDCVVVGLQLVEQLFLAIRDGSGSYSLSVFRMLRFLRLVRVVRLARIMRLIGELRTIVVSIMGSMRSLGWTVCLLLLMIYMVAVYLTQLVADWRDWRLERMDDTEETRADGMDLEYYYGSVLRSVLSLYQSISGGISWDVACAPLITYISPLAGVLFSLYIAFAILAIMNVVTGVFVESALVTAKDDKDLVMLNNVREVFSLSDEDGNGIMTWDEFRQQLDQTEMQELFQMIGIDPKEARALFQLLDFDGTGSINLAEFYDGCVRMKGEAKAIDLLTVMYENRQTSRRVITHLKAIEHGLEGLFGFLTGQFPPEGGGVSMQTAASHSED